MEKVWTHLRPFVTYYRVHVLYIVALSLVGGGIIYGIELRGDFPITSIEALVMAASAASVTGLSAVSADYFRGGSMAVLMILIMLGSTVNMSTVPLLLRQKYLRSKWGPRLYEPIKPEKVDRDVPNIEMEVNRTSLDWQLSMLDTERLEYRAGILLVKVVFSYSLGMLLTGFIIISCHLSFSYIHPAMQPYGPFHPAAWAIIHSIEAFGNAGFSLNPLPIQYDVVVLLTLSALILAGNVAYPICLRAVVWTCMKFAKDKTLWLFLLRHPRVCYTALFPTFNTRMLLAAVVSSTLLQWIVMMSLDWDAESVDFLPGGQKVVVLLFQVVSTRAAGFQTIDYNTFSPTTQVLTAVMMYLAAVPYILTVRSSMIHDEQQEINVDVATKARFWRFWIYMRERRFFVSETILLLLWALIILTIEGRSLITDANSSVWKCLFEIISAYGNVGLTLGYPGLPSFTSHLRPASKMFIGVLMIQGRHRGLASDFDVSIRADSGILEALPRTSNDQSFRKSQDFLSPTKRRSGSVFEMSIPISPRSGSFIGSPRTHASPPRTPMPPPLRADQLSPTSLFGDTPTGSTPSPAITTPLTEKKFSIRPKQQQEEGALERKRSRSLPAELERDSLEVHVL